jgi:excisionase family DNA binding protein
MDGKWITVNEAALLARVTERTIRHWIDKGAVRVARPCAVARRLLVRREDVDADTPTDRT